MIIKNIHIKSKHIILISILTLFIFIISALIFYYSKNKMIAITTNSDNESDFIKWVDFNVTSEALKLTADLDIKSHNNNEEIKYNWIELLAYLACIYGGNFKNFNENDLNKIVENLQNGKSIEE